MHESDLSSDAGTFGDSGFGPPSNGSDRYGRVGAPSFPAGGGPAVAGGGRFAISTARRFERRALLRRGANAAFYSGMLAATGALTTRSFLQDPAWAQSPRGPGCPDGCGPSPCCNTAECSIACCASQGTSNACSASCCGYQGTWSGTSCWTSQGKTCCDCNTCGASSKFCNQSEYHGYCICYKDA